MQQMMIDKIVNLDMRKYSINILHSIGGVYEQNLQCCEVMDSVLKGNEYTVSDNVWLSIDI